MTDFKDTEFYKQGAFHAKLGKLLMTKSTTIEDLSDFAYDYNSKVSVRLTDISLLEVEDE